MRFPVRCAKAEWVREHLFCIRAESVALDITRVFSQQTVGDRKQRLGHGSRSSRTPRPPIKRMASEECSPGRIYAIQARK